MKITKRTEASRWMIKPIIEWCIKNYGRSKYNGSYPQIRYTNNVDPTIRPDKIFGTYNPWSNLMLISKDGNKNVNQLIDTIIHEYVHYLQPLKSHLNRVNKLVKYTRLDYKNDPLEIEAREIAKRDRGTCFEEKFR